MLKKPGGLSLRIRHQGELSIILLRGCAGLFQNEVGLLKMKLQDFHMALVLN